MGVLSSEVNLYKVSSLISDNNFLVFYTVLVHSSEKNFFGASHVCKFKEQEIMIIGFQFVQSYSKFSNSNHNVIMPEEIK